MNASVGNTRDVGWEMGARRTVAAALPVVWERMLGDLLETWLGASELPELRSRTELRRLRMSWHGAVLQLTLTEVASGTTIAFHMEKLPDREARREMVDRWNDVLDELVAALS